MPKLIGAERIGNTIITSNVEVATQPEVRKLSDRNSRKMTERQPLAMFTDDLGAHWDVMATYSTDEADPAATEVAAIARDERGTYGMKFPDGSIEPFDQYGNKHTVVEGDTFAFGARYDITRDELAVFGEEGIAGKNGYNLIETMAMYPPDEVPAQQ